MSEPFDGVQNQGRRRLERRAVRLRVLDRPDRTGHGRDISGGMPTWRTRTSTSCAAIASVDTSRKTEGPPDAFHPQARRGVLLVVRAQAMPTP
jgi:hypothetical protein